jgi:Polyketide cyclase / dehydrase and lipid transport
MLQFIRFLILSVVVLFVVSTLLSLLFPSHLRVMRAVNVAAPRARVLGAIGDLRAWTQWNEFVRSTPLTNKTWSEPSAGVGAWMQSKELTIRETTSDSDGVSLDWDLKGGKRYPGGIALLQSFPDSITVQWWFDLSFRWYPWEKLGVFVYDRKLGPAMEESLAGLKRYVEISR